MEIFYDFGMLTVRLKSMNIVRRMDLLFVSISLPVCATILLISWQYNWVTKDVCLIFKTNNQGEEQLQTVMTTDTLRETNIKV